jgi:cell division topological specificity factor
MILNWLLGRTRGSASAAKERLQFVLVHDRAGITPATIDAMKDDLIKAISQHVEIDSKSVEITLTKGRRTQRLVADIPLATGRQKAH